MTRTIQLELKDFDALPESLLDANRKPLTKINIELKNLFHHYFQAKFGPCIQDTGHYEYERCLTTGPDWRFRRDGIGVDKESKRNASNELGKAFARWFLDAHLGFTYFCPLEELLDRNIGGFVWVRSSKGDLPDYVCGPDESKVNLLEAKGRYSPVTFKTKEFGEFRAQLQRVELRENGTPIRVKGFVSVARWATERQAKITSTLLVEDPWTRGQPPGRDWRPGPIGRAMVLGHYSPIFEHLRLHTYAAAIREGRALPQQTVARRGLWECVRGPLANRRFVGGVLAVQPMVFPPQFMNFWGHPDYQAFVLAPPPQFFGLEQKVMDNVLSVGRSGLESDLYIDAIDVPSETGSLSLLRDGSVLGPADYFAPVEVVEL